MLAADRLEMGRPATPRRRTRRSLLETAPLIQTNAGNGRAGGAQRPPRAAGGTTPDRLAARLQRTNQVRDRGESESGSDAGGSAACELDLVALRLQACFDLFAMV